MKEGSLKLILKLLKCLIEKIYLSFNDNLVYYESVTQCKSRFYYDTIVCPKYENKECKVTFIDINNLKEINDTHGHQQGTAHIKDIANQLKALRNTCEVCRVGGDEFILICNKDFMEESLKHIQGISYGLVYKRKQDIFYETIKKADRKMYEMKKAMKKDS